MGNCKTCKYCTPFENPAEWDAFCTKLHVMVNYSMNCGFYKYWKNEIIETKEREK